MNLAAAPTEPRRTIYFDHWQDAHVRTLGLPARRRKLFAGLLAHVDQGWAHVRRLQLLYEQSGRAQVSDPALAGMLDLIDGDIVDVYRLIAGDSAALVPGWEGWPGRADTGDLDGEATLFARYLLMLRLAVEAPAAPAELRGVAREVAAAMEGWTERFCEMMRKIDRAVIEPMLRAAEDAIAAAALEDAAAARGAVVDAPSGEAA